MGGEEDSDFLDERPSCNSKSISRFLPVCGVTVAGRNKPYRAGAHLGGDKGERAEAEGLFLEEEQAIIADDGQRLDNAKEETADGDHHLRSAGGGNLQLRPNLYPLNLELR